MSGCDSRFNKVISQIIRTIERATSLLIICLYLCETVNYRKMYSTPLTSINN